jgi:hypothetical protein
LSFRMIKQRRSPFVDVAAAVINGRFRILPECF